MRAVWAILLGAAADALPGLYRWRDDQGVLQVTDKPPRGRACERIRRDGDGAIAVDGQRQDD